MTSPVEAALHRLRAHALAVAAVRPEMDLVSDVECVADEVDRLEAALRETPRLKPAPAICSDCGYMEPVGDRGAALCAACGLVLPEGPNTTPQEWCPRRKR